MYDDRYARRQARAYRRQMRRGYRNSLGGLACGAFFIGLALAFALSGSLAGHGFLFFLFAGLAFCSLFGSASSMNPRGLYGGLQGFVWLMGLAFLFVIGFWPWILVVIGISAILGSLVAPITAGLMRLGFYAATQRKATRGNHSNTSSLIKHTRQNSRQQKSSGSLTNRTSKDTSRPRQRLTRRADRQTGTRSPSKSSTSHR